MLASDGAVQAQLTILNLTNRQFKSVVSENFIRFLPAGTDRDVKGWLIYQYADGNVSVSQSLGKKMSISVMLEKIEDYVCDIA